MWQDTGNGHGGTSIKKESVIFYCLNICCFLVLLLSTLLESLEQGWAKAHL